MRPLQKSRSNVNTPKESTQPGNYLARGSRSWQMTSNSSDVVLHTGKSLSPTRSHRSDEATAPLRAVGPAAFESRRDAA